MKRILFGLMVTVCAFTLAQAEPMAFRVTGGEGNLIRLESKAPLETIVGVTDQVSGTIMLDPADLTSGVSAAISVVAASLETGNKIRDGHMRDNHLHIEDYPEIKFTINNLKLDGTLPKGSSRTFDVVGEFSLHGLTRQVNVPVEVNLYHDAGRLKLHVAAAFQVKLSDYNIPRPQFLIMKLDEVQHISVDIWGEAP